MRISIKQIFFVILLGLLSYISNCQEDNRDSVRYKQNILKDGWGVNLNFGSSLFYGDLRVYDFYPVSKYNNERKWAIGGMLTKDITTLATLQVMFLSGKLAGTKRLWSDGTKAGLFFNSSYTEFNLNAKVNISNILFSYNPKRKINFYGLIGYGIVNYRTIQRKLGTEELEDVIGYSEDGQRKESPQSEAIIPMGLGLTYKLDDHFSLDFQSSIRKMFVDNLDVLEGNSGVNDMYGYTSLGVTYNFGFSKKKKEELETPLYIPEQVAQKEEVAIDDPSKVVVRSLMPSGIIYNESFNVKIIISKNNIEGPGKLVQEFPAGLTPIVRDLPECSMEIESQNLIIRWDEMPNTKDIVIEYTVKSTKMPTGSQNINGRFDYIFENSPKSVHFINRIYVEDPFNPNDTISKQVVETNIYDENYKPKKADNNLSNAEYKDEDSDINKVYEVVEKDKKLNDNIDSENNYSENNRPNDFNDSVSTYTNEPAENTVQDGEEVQAFIEINNKLPEAGVYGDIEYKVQICATYKEKADINRLFKNYNIKEPITEDIYGDWYKYTIGSFSDYNEAMAYRDKIRETTPAKTAFVVAFKNTERLGYARNPNNQKTYQQVNRYIKSEKGISFRVQVAASKQNNNTTAEFIYKSFNLNETVCREEIDEWHKFTVGDFATYKEAKEHCNILREKIDGAFVVAYKDGVRILLSEALKLVNN